MSAQLKRKMLDETQDGPAKRTRSSGIQEPAISLPDRSKRGVKRFVDTDVDTGSERKVKPRLGRSEDSGKHIDETATATQSARSRSAKLIARQFEPVLAPTPIMTTFVATPNIPVRSDSEYDSDWGLDAGSCGEPDRSGLDPKTDREVKHVSPTVNQDTKVEMAASRATAAAPGASEVATLPGVKTLATRSINTADAAALTANADSRHQLVLLSRNTSVPLPALVDLSDPSRPTVVFGRSLQAHVLLKSTRAGDTVSRTHASITRSDPDCPRFKLTDTSLNGTYVNDKRIGEAELKAGDVITFGGPAATKVGQYAPQPDSEFIYRFERIDSRQGSAPGQEPGAGAEVKDESLMDSMRALTDNVSLIISWLSALPVVIGLLSGDENSEFFHTVRDTLDPVFGLVGLPVTRFSVLCSVAALLALLLLGLLVQRKCRR